LRERDCQRHRKQVRSSTTASSDCDSTPLQAHKPHKESSDIGCSDNEQERREEAGSDGGSVTSDGHTESELLSKVTFDQNEDTAENGGRRTRANSNTVFTVVDSICVPFLPVPDLSAPPWFQTLLSSQQSPDRASLAQTMTQALKRLPALGQSIATSEKSCAEELV